MRRRTVVDRTLIALLGGALLLGGLWLLGAARAVDGRAPAWWPRPDADGVLVDRATLGSLREAAWWLPAVIGTGTLVTVLCLRWFVTRTPLRRPFPTAPLGAPRADVRLTALEEAVREDSLHIDGIVRAHCRITARRGRAHLALRVWTEPGTAPRAVLARLGSVTAAAESALRPVRLVTRTRVSSRSRATPRAR
ncbi:hypothetical protein [Streptomyces californicus]|uniref:hypothetical protein n=1 Tax=Streptomyces californicus TaxID=67351 RepID=UPI001E527098|nr:hypothetical protein [Streptomyces californicus]MCC0576780.1 hypothetical protein [Streptomyces californicus]